MPTYQYACTECGEPLEVVQKFTDDPLTECPACHGRLRKVFNSVGIVFKGSGFYRTDSRDAAKKKSGSDGAASPTAGASTSSSSSEASATTSSGSSSDASSGSKTSKTAESKSATPAASKAASA